MRILKSVRSLAVVGWVVLLAASSASAQGTGPLRVDPNNRRYFTDGSGKSIYLTGAHTWTSLQDLGQTDPPPAFDYIGYLNMLQSTGQNFVRMWNQEQARWQPEGELFCAPLPFARTGPGAALDGKPKFNLNQFNQAFFDRLRSRVIAARDRGIYVSIMLFQGWSIGDMGLGANPWPGHPFHASNNVNGINGDSNGDGSGFETHSMAIPAVTAVQDAFVRKVIDTVNDLDNVLYEIANESPEAGVSWQYHLIDLIHNYEAGKPKRHPVGMTALQLPSTNNGPLFNSPADWISPGSPVFLGDPNGYANNPPASSGAKVVIPDTDHLWGIGGDHLWVWKSFTRGLNPVFMETATPFVDVPGADNTHRNMGATRTYAAKMNLTSLSPRGDLSSTGYALAAPGSEYLVYQPGGGNFQVNLSTGTYGVEWFNPGTLAPSSGGSISAAGGWLTLTPPFGGAAILYLKIGSAPPPPPPPPPAGQTPFTGSPMAIPGTIKLNEYDWGGEGVAYHDVEAQNFMDAAYRPGEGVDTAPGRGVGWIQAGEWIEYTVNVAAAGTYRMQIPVSHPGPGGRFHVEFGGVDRTGSLQVPDTGGWGNTQNILVQVSLPAGRQVMRLAFDANGSTGYVCGMGDLQISSTTAPPPPSGGQTPYTGTPMAIPGTILTAQYDNGGEGVAYHDGDAANRMSSTYRPGQGVDSNGSGVGWISAGEWLEYTVTVAASGMYTLSIPMSHPGTGGSMHVSFNGVNVTGPLTLPTTATWGTFVPVVASVNLSAGTQILQVVFDTNGSTGYGPGLGDITVSGGGTGGSGLTGQYFDNLDFTALRVTRTDAAVNFDWGFGSPDPSMGADTFSIRWTGQVQPQFSETYTFHATVDDGVRLWVNNQLIIDRWFDQPATEWSGSISLVGGQKYSIRMEFYENGGWASAKLQWSSSSTSKQVVPQSRLFPN